MANAMATFAPAPQQLLDAYRGSDAFTSLAARALVAQQQSDSGFYRELLAAEARIWNLEPRPPAGRLLGLRAQALPRDLHMSSCS